MGKRWRGLTPGRLQHPGAAGRIRMTGRQRGGGNPLPPDVYQRASYSRYSAWVPQSSQPRAATCS